jgi:OOP family OmpA-OmpF porin
VNCPQKVRLYSTPRLLLEENMNADDRCPVLRLGAVVLLIVGSAGCLATHKYVQEQAIAPENEKIQTVDKKVDTKASELDQRITDVDHRSEQNYSAATAKAEAADQDAQKANQAAQGAQQTADKGVNLATQTAKDLDNVDNYQPVKTASVLFDFNKWNLTDDGKQALGDITQSVTSMKHFAIEVEGFTDTVGSKQYNIELSRRRAEAVVRYLTEDGHVPLVRIHVIGLGEDQPVGDNHTRDGRKQNRRVEVRIMAATLGQQASASH